MNQLISSQEYLDDIQGRWRRRWQLQCFALQCLYCFCLFFLFFVSQTRSVFTRDELLNIRQNTPQNLLLDFDYSDVLLDIVVGGAAALFR